MPYFHAANDKVVGALPKASAPRRFCLILLAGIALFILLASPIPARGERFYAIVPLLFLLDTALFRREPWRRRALLALMGGGIGAAYALGFGLTRAVVPGGQVRAGEALHFAWFLVSLAVIGFVAWRVIAWLPPRWGQGSGGIWIPTAKGVLFLLLFTPYLFTATNIHRLKLSNRDTPRRYGLAYEDVQARTGDGVLLRGWFIPSPGSDTVVLVCHGVSANKASMLPLVRFLHGAGCHLCLFDFRGHGDSGGHTVSFGIDEMRDVAAAVRCLAGRRDVKHIVGYAFSMGGSALLQAAPDLPQIEGVMVDSTFADFPRASRAYARYFLRFLGPPLIRLGDPYLRLELGRASRDIRPVDRVAAISPRPLLIIHGTADRVVPFSQGAALYHAARAPKEFYRVPGAPHIQAHVVAGAAYERRVEQFLRRCVALKP